MATADYNALQAALQWHIDNGADEALGDTPRRIMMQEAGEQMTGGDEKPVASSGAFTPPVSPPPGLMGSPALREEAVKLAAAAKTLEDLKNAIAAFDGIDLKKTATNLVFCDGNPEAPVMLVGEAPGGDEDRLGRPFVGVSGQLLDRILACIGLDRKEADPARAVYISNILNWRPPGNRTPTPAEVEVSLPFIERHIALVKPKILVFVGGVSAKALLNSTESVSKLRGSWRDYRPQIAEVGIGNPVPAIATYHPAYLLRTPAQKKAVWNDMLIIQEKRRAMGLI